MLWHFVYYSGGGLISAQETHEWIMHHFCDAVGWAKMMMILSLLILNSNLPISSPPHHFLQAFFIHQSLPFMTWMLTFTLISSTSSKMYLLLTFLVTHLWILRMSARTSRLLKYYYTILFTICVWCFK